MGIPKRYKRVTADDVAKVAEVSRSAVSRTFTPGAIVAAETRARVTAAADALGYLAPRKTIALGGDGDRVVAVVMSNLRSPYFAELSERLNDELWSKGFRAQFIISSDAAHIDRLVEDAVSRRIHGLITFAAGPSPKLMATARVAGVPTVILNRSERIEGASLVWIDGPETGRAVAKMMLDEGRRRPLAIAAQPIRSRELVAFAEAMEVGGSAPCRWVDTGWDYEDGARAAEAVLAAGEQYDAIFAASDGLAIGFLDAARNRGVDVPKDMSLMGFGDTRPSNWVSHRISTVRLPVISLIQTAVSTLVARIEAIAQPPPRIWLSCDIIERGTSLGTTGYDATKSV